MKNTRQKNLILIASVIALAATAFFTLISAQEKHNIDFGLPELSLPKPDSLTSLFDDFVPDEGTPAMSTQVSDAGVQVHFIDVGQGKSILVTAPEKTVLIDAGERDQGTRVLRYLSSAGVKNLDIVIGTHPHSDHIGGLSMVIDAIDIGSVILPVVPDGLVPTSSAYRRLLKSISNADLEITPASPDTAFDLGGGAELVMLAPLAGHEYQELNSYSIVCRLDFGETSFLFTGDIHRDAESDLIAAGESLRASVLDVAHHGSSSSTSKRFLEAVNPGIAVISCGIDNKHGHPHREVMSILKNHDTTILRTDLNGSVIIHSDGESLGIETEKGSDS